MTRIHLTLCSLLLFCISCSVEGEGGTATLTGIVIGTEYDVFGDPITSYPAQEERVYIVYGDNETYNDDLRTHFDGTYSFPFLRKGKYTVYAYSNCPSCPGNSEALVVEVEISKAGSIVKAPDITIRTN